MGDKIHVEDVPDVPTGNFYAKIVKSERYEGKYDPAVRIFFMVAVGDVKVGPINGLFPMKATVANKTGKLLLATLGECSVDKIYDLDELVDKRCWVEVVRLITDDGPISRVKKVFYPHPNAAALAQNTAGAQARSNEKPAVNDVFDKEDGMPF